MSVTRYVLAALVLLVSGCMTPAPIQPPSTFYVMRHLDTPAGLSDPDLTEAGRKRAALLADWFAEEPPVTIFVTNTRRAQQTAAPLAERLGIEPRIYDPADLRGLISEVMKEPAPVLIVGHSNTVPDIVAALSGNRPGPLAHEDFGDVWRIGGKNRTVTKTKLP